MAVSASSKPLLAVGDQPRRVLVRIGDHPGGCQERRVENGLAPLEGDFGACCHDGNPYEEQEQSDLKSAPDEICSAEVRSDVRICSSTD